MADIEHITIDGDDYDISDPTARENIETETTERQTADTTLQSDIETETTERQTADKALQSDITTLQELCVFCTQSEYDALPNTKLTDGKFYIVSTS